MVSMKTFTIATLQANGFRTLSSKPGHHQVFLADVGVPAISGCLLTYNHLYDLRHGRDDRPGCFFDECGLALFEIKGFELI